MIVTFEHFITVQFNYISLILNSLLSIFLSFRQRLRINAYLSHSHRIVIITARVWNSLSLSVCTYCVFVCMCIFVYA